MGAVHRLVVGGVTDPPKNESRNRQGATNADEGAGVLHGSFVGEIGAKLSHRTDPPPPWAAFYGNRSDLIPELSFCLCPVLIS